MIQAASPYYTASRAYSHLPHGHLQSHPRTVATVVPDKESSKVLQWQHEVARSVSVDDDNASEAPTSSSYHERAPPPATLRRSETYPAAAPSSHHYSHAPSQQSGTGNPGKVLRREIVTTESYRRHHGYGGSNGGGGNGGGSNGGGGGGDSDRGSGIIPEEKSKPMSKGAIIGTLLGAAAGAAVAYAMVRSESPERASPSQSQSFAPRDSGRETLTRAESYPAESTYSYGNHRRDVIEHIPARSYVSQSRYSGETEDIRPRYVVPAPASRALAPIEERSYVSRSSRQPSRSGVDDVSGTGSRHERPLAILPAPTPRNRSPASGVSGTAVSRRSSRHDAGEEREGNYHDREGSYHTTASSKRDHDRESYHTARSAHSGTTARSGSTVKPLAAHYVTAPPSKASSTTTIRVKSREDDAASVRPSQVELPRSSVVSGSAANSRGYEPSVAPSDSVSSVGSKRERERLIERMSQRERPSEW